VNGNLLSQRLEIRQATQLFYNSKELRDEDTPDELEMEAMVWKKIELDIHIVSEQYET
jgi:hypothetical protein